MTKTNDIDFSLILHPHGWSTAWFYINGKRFEFTTTHAFGEPYFDFIKSLSQLINKQMESTFFWYSEPGGNKIEIKRIKDRQHILNVKIAEFNNSFGEQLKEFEEILEFEIKEKHLITVAYYQLKKIETLLQDKSFALYRSNNFPFQDFMLFENKVTTYLKFI
ncbi:hypothetical protein [Aquimarina rhabdastrellae]